jgi:hypothetical protein
MLIIWCARRKRPSRDSTLLHLFLDAPARPVAHDRQAKSPHSEMCYIILSENVFVEGFTIQPSIDSRPQREQHRTSYRLRRIRPSR